MKNRRPLTRQQAISLLASRLERSLYKSMLPLKGLKNNRKTRKLFAIRCRNSNRKFLNQFIGMKYYESEIIDVRMSDDRQQIIATLKMPPIYREIIGINGIESNNSGILSGYKLE